ncbi:Uncharacterized protein TCM_018747 [Theobroma cacao]|uniref:Uncharacterized protein n=1 Tax=Theobroma cacao TaxID=3641 RepID=A0A061EFK7_THECC|nr:Uncharacterized protein TCM_018747 [Theobroma cacao]
MEINGSVGELFCHDHYVTDKCYDVWVLGELGLKNARTKLFTIGSISDAYWPLGVDSNGGFLFSIRSSRGECLVRYRSSNQETETLLHLGGSSLQLVMYAESLVSLKGGNAFIH